MKSARIFAPLAVVLTLAGAAGWRLLIVHSINHPLRIEWHQPHIDTAGHLASGVE